MRRAFDIFQTGLDSLVHYPMRSTVIVLAYVWLRVFNGFWIAGIFLAEVDAYSEFRIPFRLTTVPVILSFSLSFVMVMSGTLVSTWRAAMTSPRESMR